MKTREFKKVAAGLPLPTAPPAPGELTKVPPAELAETEPAGLAAECEESEDSSKNKANLRRSAVFQAVIAAFYLLLGDEWLAMFVVAAALLSALEGETRWRVPKPLKVGVNVLMVVMGILLVVRLILKSRGH